MTVSPPLPALPQVYDALYRRTSVRAFCPDPIDRPRIERILAAAARAPSGTNTQPWKVRVLTGAAKDRLVRAVLEFRAAQPGVENWVYPYYPSRWRDPYLARRRAVGWDLYGLLGIQKGDADKMRAQHDANFRFFDAPVGMILTIDRDLGQGSWLDYGLFLQSLALAAVAEDLGTCLQAAWAAHGDLVSQVLGIPADEVVVCGVALGKPDPMAVINSLKTSRATVDQFTSFQDE